MLCRIGFIHKFPSFSGSLRRIVLEWSRKGGDTMAENESISKTLALLWLQGRDTSNLTPEEFYALYEDAKKRIESAKSQNQQSFF
nr:MAG TPA: hypothetical protein [Caudoviricetes sp.]